MTKAKTESAPKSIPAPTQPAVPALAAALSKALKLVQTGKHAEAAKALALRKLFSQQFSWMEYLIAFTMTVGLAGLMTLVSTRILNQEKALFKM